MLDTKQTNKAKEISDLRVPQVTHANYSGHLNNTRLKTKLKGN